MLKELGSSSDSKQLIPLWRFSFGSRSAQEELSYREHFLDDDIRQFCAIIYAITAFMATLTLIDINKLTTDPGILFGTILRTVFIAMGLGLIWAMKSFRRPAAIDLSAITYSASVALSIVVFHLISDASAVRIIAVVTIFIFATYIAFPTYASWVSIPVAILLLGEGYLLFTSDRSDLIDNRYLTVAIAFFSLYVGIAASTHHHRARYQSFRAMRAVKMLSGLLPICANCKKIRDDQGYYQQIEHYISEHSEAQFTHGICPSCIPLLYPELNAKSEL